MTISKSFILSAIAGLAISGAARAEVEVTGLRADVYSDSAIELFWDRVPNVMLSFEIVRDDGMTFNTDGISYYDSTRQTGISNEYAVTAIETDGTRSIPQTILVEPFSPQELRVRHLRADVYSDTTAELFWIRDPGKPCTYEIARDDGEIFMTDGNSIMDRNREPGTFYTYRVTAIDSNGNRSSETSLRVAPFGYELINSPPATGLRATVYSNTSVELHWDRMPNRALRYEILRDDGLSNVTNGVSYYDNQRVPGVTNTYIVTTIDEEGNRSTPVTIEVGPF